METIEKKTKYIYIFASDLSTFTSYSQYSIVSSFERLLKRVDKEDYTKIMDMLKDDITKREDELIQAMETECDEPASIQETKKRQEEIQELKMNISKTQLTKEDFMKEILGKTQVEKIIDSKFTTETKKRNLTKLVNKSEYREEIKRDLKQKITTLVNTDHGNKEETSVLEKFQKAKNTDLDESQKFYSKHAFTIETPMCNYKVSLGGKMDGIDHNNRKVVEIKNRVRQLFGTLREYEKVQLMSYLYMTGYEKGLLVERYRDKSNEFELEYSERYMSKILDKLKLFCQEFCKFIERPIEEKKAFYNQTEREKEDYILDILDNVSNQYESNCDDGTEELRGYNSDISSCLLSDTSI